MSRVEELFGLVLSYAAKKQPILRSVRVRFCRLADDYHRRAWRFFAHSNHLRVYTVCFAKAAEKELTDGEILGVSAHELGHVWAILKRLPVHERSKDRSPELEEEANRVARDVLGFSGLRYNARTIQELRFTRQRR